MYSLAVPMTEWIVAVGGGLGRTLSWPSIRKMVRETCGVPVLPMADHPVGWERNHLSACYQPDSHSIYVGESVKTPSVVLHECAHVLVPGEMVGEMLGDDATWHSQPHLDKWVDLMVDYGVYTRGELRESMAPFGLEVE